MVFGTQISFDTFFLPSVSLPTFNRFTLSLCSYYVSAFYPLCLIGMTWFFIKLHTRDIKPITWLWSKLNQLFPKSTVTRKYSLIDVFATFFLLSYAKLIYTVVNTSYGIKYHLNNGTVTMTFHVHSDPSIIFFSREHIPFITLSLAIFLVAIIPLTLLLALYPVRNI